VVLPGEAGRGDSWGAIVQAVNCEVNVRPADDWQSRLFAVAARRDPQSLPRRRESVVSDRAVPTMPPVVASAETLARF
jgi:hypothetical protein